ncbi:MAG: GNAT family N-acetyltransferase [Pseudonocardia sp.]|nr:GNAT family N-acetyltransferase [Pseudonocardia sp.]
MITRHDGHEIDDDPARIDLDAVWGFLSTEAYWGRWRTRADFETQFAAAWRVLAVHEPASDRTVGFARAVSDGVSFAYLADVYVHPDARGRGLGVALVGAMLEAGEHMRWTLHTADAHGLYRRFGFAAPDDTALERPAPRR